MDKTVPPGAALLLDFIGDIEAPKGYDTVYGNNQGKLKKPVTQMTLGEIQDAQGGWTKQFGSSATGRYQFMKATLAGLIDELKLSRSQVLDADLQDRLGYHLLKRRGYEDYMRGRIGRTEFCKRLAMEWASLPVLVYTKGGSRDVSRGQSYYAGDGKNKSLVTPERVETVLSAVMVAKPPTPKPESLTPPVVIPPAPAPIRHDGAHEAPASEGFWDTLVAALVSIFRGR